MSDAAGEVDMLESASKIGNSNRKLQACRSWSPCSHKRRVRVQNTSNKREELATSAGRNEKKYEATRVLGFCYSSEIMLSSPDSQKKNRENG